MRISDWSSDVCSSDLGRQRCVSWCSEFTVSHGPLHFLQRHVAVLLPGILQLLVAQHVERPAEAPAGAVRLDDVVDEAARGGDEGVGELLVVRLGALGDLLGIAAVGARYEEHTSELQSLMRTSYAVFCLNTINLTIYN